MSILLEKHIFSKVLLFLIIFVHYDTYFSILNFFALKALSFKKIIKLLIYSFIPLNPILAYHQDSYGF